MPGKASIVLYLHMARQDLENLIPWWDMEPTRVCIKMMMMMVILVIMVMMLIMHDVDINEGSNVL